MAHPGSRAFIDQCSGDEALQAKLPRVAAPEPPLFKDRDVADAVARPWPPAPFRRKNARSWCTSFSVTRPARVFPTTNAGSTGLNLQAA